MFDAFKGEIDDAARAAVSSMPPAEAQGHAQTLLAGLRADGQDDLAKELEEVMRPAGGDPRAAGAVLMAFVERHPDVVEKYAPPLATLMRGAQQQP